MQKYKVVWEIDMEADTPKQAAEEAFECMQEPNTCASFFSVFKDNIPVAEVDLYEGTVKLHEQTREEKYVAEGGMDCPHCGHESSCVFDSGVSGEDVTKSYQCDKCFKTWTKIYGLKGVDIHE